MRIRCLMLTVLCALVVMSAMISTSAYAQAINPDDLERYTPTTGWTPTWPVEGWTRMGTYYGADDAIITAAGGYAGSQGLTLKENTGWGIRMGWTYSLNNTAFPRQLWTAKVRGTAADLDGTASITISPNTGVYSWEYPGAGQLTESSTPTTAKLYPGPVNIPGGSSLAFNTWYTFQMEVDYTTVKVRARFGPTDGAMNDWTNWIAQNPDGAGMQCDRLVFGVYGTFDIDDVSLVAVPEPASLATLLLGLAGTAGIAIRRRR